MCVIAVRIVHLYSFNGKVQLLFDADNTTTLKTKITPSAGILHKQHNKLPTNCMSILINSLDLLLACFSS